MSIPWIIFINSWVIKSKSYLQFNSSFSSDTSVGVHNAAQMNVEY